MANRLNAPPITSRYQLSRLSLGNARSRAPIMIGRKKFPSTAGRVHPIRKRRRQQVRKRVKRAGRRKNPRRKNQRQKSRRQRRRKNKSLAENPGAAESSKFQ